MGRELKRVPIGFDYPLNKVWYGYFMNGISTCNSKESEHCEQCKEFARLKNIPLTDYGCPNFELYLKEVTDKLKELCEVPNGEGYQLWETTSEGSPVSPIFSTLEELCDWCEDNATTFDSFKATKEEWMKMLSDDFVHHKQGNVIFI